MTISGVTGASGFIGSHLVERLLTSGVVVRACVRSNSTSSLGNLRHLSIQDQSRLDIRVADLLDPTDLARAFVGIDTLYHLAAQVSVPYSFKAPSLFVKTNVEGTLNVLETARRAGVRRLVVVSSSEVYGSDSKQPLSELDLPIAKSPYAATKIAAEKLAEAYSIAFRMEVVIVRPFNTFGPRQSQRALIPRIVTQALASESVALGNIDSARDFLFVEDTADGLTLAGMESSAVGRTINLASGKSVTVRDVVKQVGSILGKKLSIVVEQSRVRQSNAEVWHLCGDPSLAANLLAWSPKHTLEEGLSKTVDWLRGRTEHQNHAWVE